VAEDSSQFQQGLQVTQQYLLEGFNQVQGSGSSSVQTNSGRLEQAQQRQQTYSFTVDCDQGGSATFEGERGEANQERVVVNFSTGFDGCRSSGIQLDGRLGYRLTMELPQNSATPEGSESSGSGDSFSESGQFLRQVRAHQQQEGSEYGGSSGTEGSQNGSIGAAGSFKLTFSIEGQLQYSGEVQGSCNYDLTWKVDTSAGATEGGVGAGSVTYSGSACGYEASEIQSFSQNSSSDNSETGGGSGSETGGDSGSETGGDSNPWIGGDSGSETGGDSGSWTEGDSNASSTVCGQFVTCVNNCPDDNLQCVNNCSQQYPNGSQEFQAVVQCGEQNNCSNQSKSCLCTNCRAQMETCAGAGYCTGG
jgi:hypothetical protein